MPFHSRLVPDGNQYPNSSPYYEDITSDDEDGFPSFDLDETCFSFEHLSNPHKKTDDSSNPSHISKSSLSHIEHPLGHTFASNTAEKRSLDPQPRSHKPAGKRRFEGPTQVLTEEGFEQLKEAQKRNFQKKTLSKRGTESVKRHDNHVSTSTPASTSSVSTQTATTIATTTPSFLGRIRKELQSIPPAERGKLLEDLAKTRDRIIASFHMDFSMKNNKKRRISHYKPRAQAKSGKNYNPSREQWNQQQVLLLPDPMSFIVQEGKMTTTLSEVPQGLIESTIKAEDNLAFVTSILDPRLKEWGIKEINGRFVFVGYYDPHN